MAPPLIHLRDICLSFGGTALLAGAEMLVRPGDRLCVIGRNGAGKSTLLKIAAGLVEPDAGERFIQPGATVRYLPQEPDFEGFPTVASYVEAGLAPGDDRFYAERLVSDLGLFSDLLTANLSGGEARRAALAKALAPRPDILLLDEPTNHLDLPAIEWLEQTLKDFIGAIVLISHDRRLLANLSERTLWIDRGISRSLERGFAHFETWRDALLEQESMEQHKLARQIAREEHWLRYGVTARRKRNQKRLADLQSLRKRQREHRGPMGKATMEVDGSGASGQRVIEAEHITKRFGEQTIVADFSIRVMRGARVGIVGPNGSGKTTLLGMLTGQLSPDAGKVTLGSNLDMITLDQNRAALRPEWTLAEALAGGNGDTVEVNGARKHVAAYMKDFLFPPEQARTPVSALSGGEKARLMLARALARRSNLMVLDEPTNDLDLETLDVLEDMLADYAGTILLVSHDRDFLDRTVTSIVAHEGAAQWREFPGGYTDMLAQRKPRPDKRESTTANTGKTNRTPPPPPPRRRTGKTRLSFKDMHALKTLPDDIAKLEHRIAALNTKLSDPELYGRDPARFTTLTDALAATQVELEEKENRWLELEERREELNRENIGED